MYTGKVCTRRVITYMLTKLILCKRVRIEHYVITFYWIYTFPRATLHTMDVQHPNKKHMKCIYGVYYTIGV